MSNFKFKEALEADLAARDMTQAELAAALSRPEETLMVMDSLPKTEGIPEETEDFG